MSDYNEEEYEQENDQLLDGEIEEIHEEYRKNKLVESLIGPSLSTVFHVALIVILAFMIVEEIKKPPLADIEITVMPDKPIVIPPKPDLDIPEPDKPTDIAISEPLQLADDNPEDSPAIENVDDKTPQTDDNLPQEKVLDVIASVSAVITPMAGGRTPGGIKGRVNLFGPDKNTIPDFENGLKWLAKVQNPNGSWGSDAQPAYTGLALLTFLAYGETNTSKKYGKTVKSAMQWLVNDPIDVKKHHGYPHAVKTYALCEAYGMTGMSILEDKMNECVRVLIDGQQPGGAYDYNYKKSEGRQDLSFAGWNFQALKAASLASCEEPGLQEAIYKAVDWLKKMGGSSKSFAYTTSNNDPNKANGAGKWTMRSVGVLCLQLFGHGRTPEIQDELDKIASVDLKNYNYDKAPSRSLYGWYYATNAMFQAQGKYWKAWKKKFQAEIRRNKHADGYWTYPGKTHIPGDELSHRVYATTLNCLQLSVFFRYLPTNNVAPRDKATVKAKKVEEEEGLDLID